MLEQRARGYLYALTGIIILSPDVLLLRLMDADIWTTAAWRGLVAGAVLLIGTSVLTHRKPVAVFLAMGKVGYAGILNLALSMIFFVAAVSYTTAANVLIIIAFSPLISALFSRLLMKEQLPLRTWIAILVCVFGIAAIFIQQASTGDLLGNICAALCGLTLAIHMIISRYYQHVNPVFISAFGMLLGGIIAMLLASERHLVAEQWLYLVLMAVWVVPLSFALITLSARYILAPEVGLVMQLETLLGSFFVWLGIGETPSLQTIVAGTLVITTLTLHSLLALRANRRLAVS